MARHRDARSPSPVGSLNSASKRSRRNDDRNRPDDRSRRDRRTRSRSPDRRYRDRDSHRRDRSRDRREDDHYRSGPRDRSRDRRRSRDRDVARDHRRRSRDADRSRRDHSRDYTRRRRDPSTDSRRNGRRDDSRDRGSRKKLQLPPKPPPVAPTEDQTKADRLAKLEKWKQNLAAGKEKRQEIEGATGTRNLLNEIDKRAAIQATTPASSSPVLEATTNSPPTQESVTEEAPVENASPVPYAGKFDPKAIAKKVASSTGASKLGTDILVPGKLKMSATLSSARSGLQANDSKATAKSTSIPASQVTSKARGHVSGFGLAAKHAEPEKTSNKRALDLDEEEDSRKRLEKLPTPPPEANEDITLAAAKDDDVDDEELQDAGTEEEAAAALRDAAEKRAQTLAHQTDEAAAEVNGDVEMTEAPAMSDATPMEVVEDSEEQEEIDPLDAFMTDLGDPMAHPSKGKSFKTTKSKAQEAEALFGDDDAADLKAVEADPDEILMSVKRKVKKDIVVDHKKIAYEPFRRAFFTPPTELGEMTEEEVVDLRMELGIKIRGVDLPKLVSTWSQCGLGVQVLDVISKLRYTSPSTIQRAAIPAISSGRDVIGVAKTGSGKTIAFLLPMFRHIMDQRPLDMLEGPIALLLTPTRELATQIHSECRRFLKPLGLRAVCAYGGDPIKGQIGELKRGAEIVVATPGRLIDLLSANGGRVTNLRRITYVVLDEADRMWDMGFAPQVDRILQNVRPDRQTVLFSATFPRSLEALARKTLTKPIEIVCGGKSVVAPEITQIVEVRTEESKFVRLLELLGNLYEDEKNEDNRVLVFVDRQESADSLLRDLLRRGYSCLSLHGGKDQQDRDGTIDDFKRGVVPILIATSVAARGLDVKNLVLVVNFDCPNHSEDYLHRCGRTGRAQQRGTAVTFLTEDQDRYSLDIAKALKSSGQEIPEAVQKLVDQFTEKVKAGKEKMSGSGFGGKGLDRLDQERDAARNRERKTYKTGEEGEDDDKDDKKDAGDDLVSKAASMVQPASGGSSLIPAPASAQLPGVPKGIDLDGKITVHKTELPAGSGAAKNPLDKVSAAVANINTRLNNTGVLRQGVPIDNKGPDAGAFHATLEINDFPQKARWAVTNRTNVAKILEATGTSITTKGSFYATGKEPEGGEPKLYILVEGDTEVCVTAAMRDLLRLLKEGTIAAADSDARAPVGRYNVV